MSKEKQAKDKAVQTKRQRPEHWKVEPDEHDYPAAADYLSLLAEPNEVTVLLDGLRKSSIQYRKAKDLLRASRLVLLPEDNVHVAEDLKKVWRDERLSPVLIVRGSFIDDVALTIADGYHRVCASYHIDENANIPCHITAFPSPSPLPASSS